MSVVDDTLATAEEELVFVLAEVDKFVAGLTPAHRVFALCAFCLVLLCLMIRKPDESKGKDNKFAQFSMALFLVLIFGAGVGAIFGPFLATTGWIT